MFPSKNSDQGLTETLRLELDLSAQILSSGVLAMRPQTNSFIHLRLSFLIRFKKYNRIYVTEVSKDLNENTG